MTMFDLERYLAELILNCRSAFGERLLYMGLQGSWLRGEAHENSDIDVMVILDGFSVRDMDTYREILKEIGFYERSCGFICGKAEMKRWNPLEVCQLRHTTKDLVGVLTDYLPPATREDEINYVNLSLGNLYHELCHRYIHAEPDPESALSGKRVLYPAQVGSAGSGYGGRPDRPGNGGTAGRLRLRPGFHFPVCLVPKSFCPHRTPWRKRI